MNKIFVEELKKHIFLTLSLGRIHNGRMSKNWIWDVSHMQRGPTFQIEKIAPRILLGHSCCIVPRIPNPFQDSMKMRVPVSVPHNPQSPRALCSNLPHQLARRLELNFFSNEFIFLLEIYDKLSLLSYTRSMCWLIQCIFIQSPINQNLDFFQVHLHDENSAFVDNFRVQPVRVSALRILC